MKNTVLETANHISFYNVELIANMNLLKQSSRLVIIFILFMDYELLFDKSNVIHPKGLIKRALALGYFPLLISYLIILALMISQINFHIYKIALSLTNILENL